MKKTLLSALQKSMPLLSFSTFLIASLVGILWHFVYKWTGNQPLIGLFFPINESVWEHLKLIFFPIMVTAIPEFFIGNYENMNFSCIKLKSALLGMLSTLILFYTYTGVLGKMIDWLNILIYFISMILAYRYSHRQLKKQQDKMADNKSHSTWCLYLILAITLLFAFFSVFPPKIGLFQSP